MSERVTFPRVARTFVKNVRCKGCGFFPLRRQKTFYQTINPFNFNELTRRPKDRGQIDRELCDEGAEWQREQELCSECESKAEVSA